MQNNDEFSRRFSSRTFKELRAAPAPSVLTTMSNYLRDLYRVVALQNDRTEVVLATHLTRARAKAIIAALADVSAFSEIVIRPEPIPPQVPRLAGETGSA